MKNLTISNAFVKIEIYMPLYITKEEFYNEKLFPLVR